MKIESYDVNMQAKSSFVQKENSNVDISFTKQISVNNSSINKSNTKAVYKSEDEMSVEDRVKKRIIEQLIEQMMKKKMKVKLYPNSNQKVEDSKNANNPYSKQLPNISWGFTYESTQEYYQKSSLDFSTQAKIKTSNGEFNIDLKLSYSQEFYEVHKTRITIGASNFEDPLIINMQNNSGSLDSISKNMKFMFDLNSDGNKEEISLLKDKVGFLSLDKNKNGQIDNGNELFGANTGNGFAELKAYDKDGNNWIDENDSIFKDLRVWQKNEIGQDSLITLGEAGVGAIYLSSIGADFNYSQSIGNDNAKMKENSIFLKEDGGVGVVSSLDFRV